MKKKKTPGDIIILHSCSKNHDHMLYCSGDMLCDGCNCYFSFWAIFCSFIPLPLAAPSLPNILNNENFKTMEETPEDIIISHKCTKNHDHMPHCSWDMVCEGCNCCFSFWAIFCLFTLLTARKMKISKQWKKYSEISSFYTSVPKTMTICYTISET